MNIGKTLFAQLMDYLPWSTFDRIVARYDGNRAVRTLPCASQYQAMAFAQVTYRESLRDIEASLSAQSAKLYHMGFRGPVRRSTLADANEARDWRNQTCFLGGIPHPWACQSCSLIRLLGSFCISRGTEHYQSAAVDMDCQTSIVSVDPAVLDAY